MSVPRSSSCRCALAALVLCGLGLAACSDNSSGIGPINISIDDDGIPGSGDRVTEVRDVAGFDQIILMGEGEVIVTSGVAESLTVETDDNLLQYIQTEVVNGALELRTAQDVDIAPTKSVVYRVGSDEVNLVSLSGAGSIDLDRISATEAGVLLSGAGDIRVGVVEVEDLTVVLSGVGAIGLQGNAESLDVTATGVGGYDGGDVRSTTARVVSSGTASAVVWATDELDVVITGTGSVGYYGSPSVTAQTNQVGTLDALGAK